MAIRLKPTTGVLGLLCVMYFITYVDRVNIGMAATVMQKDLGLNHTQLGLVFSAFAWPYLLFQIIGGWVGDRFGARQTLFWCGLIWAIATIVTGFVGGIVTLFLARFLLGFGEGATFPTATRAMQNWIPSKKRGFAQGLTHSFARLGGAVTPPIVGALMLALTWRGSFVILGIVSLFWGVVWVLYFRNEPMDHPKISDEELQTLPARAAGPKPKAPWGPLVRRMWPVTLTYFCYGWALWLYLNWVPSFFKSNYHLDIKHTAIFAGGTFFAGVIGDTLGGVCSDFLLRRTGNVRFARLSVVLLGFVGALLSLLPLLYTHDIDIVSVCLASGFFFSEMVIGPIWSIPMDIAPAHAGTAAGIMNSGSALAAIVSPIAAGVMIDATHNWYLPFIASIAVMAIGAICTFMMRPEIPLEPKDATVSLGQTAAAQ